MATRAPPAGFVDLSSASRQLNTLVSVIGVVVRFELPCPTRGSDYTVSFVLRDASWQDADGPGLDFRFFSKIEANLPKVSSVGDVVVIRQIKISSYKGLRSALSHYNTENIVFPKGSIPMKEFRFQFTGKKTMHYLSTPGSRPPTVEEQQFAIALHDTVSLELKPTKSASSVTNYPKTPSNPTILQSKGSVTGAPGAAVVTDTKFRLFKDLQADTFVNLVGEIVKMHPNDFGYLEVYLTDYTSNSLMFNQLSPEDEAEIYGRGTDGDTFGYTSTRKRSQWPGPYGTMTLQIELHDPHAIWVRNNVAEGTFVALENVRVKKNKIDKLAGNLWRDQKYHEKILVTKCAEQDPRVKSILKRKQDYWNARKSAGKGVKDEADEAEPAKGKKKRKKPKKKATTTEDQGQSEVQIDAAMAAMKVEANKHVCAHQSIPVVSVSYIINNPHRNLKPPLGADVKLPFINLKCRASVRVVDFFPQDLEDFSRSLADPMYATTSDGLSESGGPSGWEWCFCLFVEDAKPAQTLAADEKPTVLKLVVGGEYAVFLLKLDATDLRKDNQTLAKLREKMFIMWGELEEQFAAGMGQGQVSKGPAFECCIQEYGVKRAEGYERVHRMWGTTIQ